MRSPARTRTVPAHLLRRQRGGLRRVPRVDWQYRRDGHDENAIHDSADRRRVGRHDAKRAAGFAWRGRRVERARTPSPASRLALRIAASGVCLSRAGKEGILSLPTPTRRIITFVTVSCLERRSPCGGGFRTHATCRSLLTRRWADSVASSTRHSTTSTSLPTPARRIRSSRRPIGAPESGLRLVAQQEGSANDGRTMRRWLELDQTNAAGAFSATAGPAGVRASRRQP